MLAKYNRSILVLLVALTTLNSTSQSQAENFPLMLQSPNLIGSEYHGAIKRRSLEKCRNFVNPHTDMSNMFAFYKADKTMSIIDKEAMSAYTQKLRNILRLRNNLTDMSRDVISASGDKKIFTQRCVLSQLIFWAQARSLLSGLDDNTALGHRQAVLEMLWTTIAVCKAYALATADGNSDFKPAEKLVFVNWLADINKEIINEFTPRDRKASDRWLDARANHWLWAGAAISLSSIILQNHTEFGWSMNVLATALKQAPADGRLPKELWRGRRSLHYQNYAVAAVTVMVASADRNNVVISEDEESKLKAIASFAADAYEKPDLIEQITGHEQEKNPSMIKWAATLSHHYERADPNFSRRLMKLGQQALLQPTGKVQPAGQTRK